MAAAREGRQGAGQASLKTRGQSLVKGTSRKSRDSRFETGTDACRLDIDNRVMPRGPRGRVQAGEYHIFTRTPGRVPFFVDDTDRGDFCKRLRTIIARLDWRCLAFSLLTNHYHLLVAVPENTPQIGMKWLNGTYAQQFNKRYGRWGHLCGARYSLVPINSERQRLAAFRYIALNPVRAGLCRRPQDWPWSSYAGTAGYAEPFSFIDDSAIKDYFGHDQSGQELLRAFVEEAVAEPLPGTVPG